MREIVVRAIVASALPFVFVCAAVAVAVATAVVLAVGWLLLGLAA